MSLTLSDEQEKALREWYQHYERRSTEKFGLGLSDILYDLVTPLFQRWRLESEGLQVMLYRASANAPVATFGANERHLAKKICEMLNREKVS